VEAEPGQPGVCEWPNELRDQFGERVAEQIVGRAAEQARSHALVELDPGQRRCPSGCSKTCCR
jgi:hypothetical protein